MSITKAPLPSAEAAEPPLLQVRGGLDRRNFEDLIARASRLRNEGATSLRIDLSESSSIGVAGLVGLFAVAELFDGRAVPDCLNGWGAIHLMLEREPGSDADPRVELSGLRPAVAEALERAGLLLRFGVAAAVPSPKPSRLAA